MNRTEMFKNEIESIQNEDYRDFVKFYLEFNGFLDFFSSHKIIELP